ncbi:RNA polymerase I-specific transcription initiation factor RRN3 [Lentinula aciculospora]|uniref:RNA polymerase I-specific transcription initiation factor RRN3 n=1 Tax=Lentinula aciculospora TaxID=153920 RepID=A0A9W9ACY9_9AGAR|nr:RNA polymerase I-specific transcription initiation factor RRN3 [Lentinula aciculospora]
MDLHSRFSHFDNKRNPKAGPQSLSQKPRFMDNPMKPNLDDFASGKQRSRKGSTGRENGSSILIRRPFVTNSRVKQEEKSRKDMYLAFVNNALQEKANGNSEPFEELVSQFNPKRSPTELPFPQPAQLRLWILALSHVVSRLERPHSSLVEAIINMPWVTMDNATVRSYTVFIGMLISARPEYLSLLLSKLSLGFTHQAGLQALSISLPEPSSSPLTRRLVFDRLHYLMRHLLSLVPTLPATLMPFLSRNFPHKRRNQTAQTTYIRNLLHISEYCPELADQILGVIVDRAIQIDVEIQIEIDEIEEEDTVQEQEDIFELDPFDVLVGQEGDEDDSDEDSSDDEFENFSDISSEGGDTDDDGGLAGRIDNLPINHGHLREMVKKLDSILYLVFEHFEAYASVAKKSNEDGDEPSRSLSLSELPPLPPISTAVNPFFDASHSSPISDFLSLSQPPPSNQAQLAQLSQLASSSSSRPSTPTSGSPAWLLPIQAPLPAPTIKVLRAQFHALLSIFDRTILRTFKSRYTQFLLFWYTSLDPEFSDIFQGMLVDRALFQAADNETRGGNSAQTHIVARAAAASYIGSFVSRAKFVDREGARRVVGVLCEFLTVHLDGVDSILKNASLSSTNARVAIEALNVIGDQNTVFYAVAQALFLIFCFRWRDLLEDGEEEEEMASVHLRVTKTIPAGKKWMKQLDVVQRVVNSVLNPLKVCSPNVANQFARVAHATDFIYCYTILESNRRSDGSSSDGSSHRSNLSAFSHGLHLTSELNTFFPFDPYKLPKSGIYIQEVYRDWTSVAIDEDSDDDDTSDSEEDSEDEEDDPVHATSYPGMPISISVVGENSQEHAGETGPGLGASFDAMSISPAKDGMNAAEQVLALS